MLIDLIRESCPDVNYLCKKTSYWEDEVKHKEDTENLADISKTLFDGFVEDYGGEDIILVSSQEELENVKEEYEDIKPVLVTSDIKYIIEENNRDYIEKKKNFKKKELSSNQKWTIWKSKYLWYLPSDGRRELEKIIEELSK